MKDTRQRILEAALAVFSRDGISGATTREIARVAKVNEVTLFRYFKNKNELLHQTLLCSASRFEQVFAEASLDKPDDLRHTVRSYAGAYASKLSDNEALIRTFIGELTRHLKLWRSLYASAAKPGRQRFINYLEAGKKAGLVRKDVDCETAVDALTGMLMSGMLRHPISDAFYSSKRYVKTCVDLFLKGIEP
jgi:AcrR family transcriptional regulator